MFKWLRDFFIADEPETITFITLEAHEEAMGVVIDSTTRLLEYSADRVSELERYNSHLEQHVETLEAALRSRR